MRRFFLLATLLVPVITQAQPRAESHARTDLEPAFGVALLGAGYVTSVLWSYAKSGDQDVLYVPVAGPWLELFSLPDCEDADVFCAHGNTTRSVLIASGAAQLVGAGLLVHSIIDRRRPEPRVLIAPLSSRGAGVSLRGRF
jgi:hypothetical protein